MNTRRYEGFRFCNHSCQHLWCIAILWYTISQKYTVACPVRFPDLCALTWASMGSWHLWRSTRSSSSSSAGIRCFSVENIRSSSRWPSANFSGFRRRELTTDTHSQAHNRSWHRTHIVTQQEMTAGSYSDTRGPDNRQTQSAPEWIKNIRKSVLSTCLTLTRYAKAQTANPDRIQNSGHTHKKRSTWHRCSTHVLVVNWRAVDFSLIA